MAPRTGPQNVTMDDLRRVTGRITRLQPGGPRPLPSQQIVSNLVGGPLPTYGKKYGGFTTQEQEVNAIIGQLAPFRQAQDLVAGQADLARQQVWTDYINRVEGIYGRQPQTGLGRPGEENMQPVFAVTQGGTEEMPTLTMTPSRLYAQLEAGRRLDPRLGQREAELAALQSKQAQWIGSPEGQAQANRLKELEAGIAATDPSKLSLRAQQQLGGLHQKLLAEYQALQGAGMPGVEEAQAAVARASRDATSMARAAETGAMARQREQLASTVAPARRLATELANIPRAELAQQLAVGRYGMDPGLAAGIFGPEFGAEQRIREASTEFTQPGQSIEEYIALNQGPVALEQYQTNRVQEALKKQEEGFRTADEEAVDLQLEQQTGVNVKTAAGDYSLSTARGYLTNPDFVAQIKQGMQAVATAQGSSVEDKKNAARNYALEYFNQTGNPVAAQILYNALTSFEFSLGFVPFSI